MTISPQDLTAEERAIVDREVFRCWFASTTEGPSMDQSYKVAFDEMSRFIEARRALFTPESEKPAQAKICPNCGEITPYDHHSNFNDGWSCEPPENCKPAQAKACPNCGGGDDWDHGAAYGGACIHRMEPAPVAAGEMPHELRNAAAGLRQQLEYYSGGSVAGMGLKIAADRIESWWRSQPAQPVAMTIERAREIAAQCWCDPETEMIEMDSRLAEAFARRLVQLQPVAAVRMTEELQRLLVICSAKADDEDENEAPASARWIRADIAAVRAQAAAQPGLRPKLEKVMDLIVFARANAQYLKDSLNESEGNYVRELMHDKLDAALAELDDYEGKEAG